MNILNNILGYVCWLAVIYGEIKELDFIHLGIMGILGNSFFILGILYKKKNK